MNQIVKRAFAVLLTLFLMATPVISMASDGTGGEMTVTLDMSGDGGEATNPINVMPCENIAVLSDKDICTAELGQLFGATVTSYGFSEFKEAGANVALKGAQPEGVIVIATRDDVVIEEEGKEPRFLTQQNIKNIVRSIRTTFGQEVPVVFALMTSVEAGDSLSEMYGVLKKSESTIKDANFYTTYSYYSETQSAVMRAECANRIIGSVLGYGVFTEPVVNARMYNDIVYYVFEDGNDKQSGKSPAQAKNTTAAVLKALLDSRGTNKNYNDNDRLVIYVRGNVKMTAAQSMLGLSVENTPMTAEGKRIPILVESYEYDGTEATRATIYTTYSPHDDGSSRMGVLTNMTLKNVTVSNEPQNLAGKACNTLWLTRSTLVLDNVKFKNSLNQPWTLYAQTNVYNDFVATEDESEAVKHTLILKNGVYDESTGVAAVVGSGYTGLYREASQGGSFPEAANHYANIIVEKGATVGKIYGFTKKNVFGGVSVTIDPGATVGTLAVTSSFSKETEIEAQFFEAYVRGVVTENIQGLGKNASFTGNVFFNILDTQINGNNTNADIYGMTFLGDEGSALTGDLTVNIQNTVLAQFAGLNIPAGLYFGGVASTADGDSVKMVIGNSTIALIGNEKLNNVDCSVAFCGKETTMYSDFELVMPSALIDMGNVEDEVMTFGTTETNGEVRHMTVELGRAENRKDVLLTGADVMLLGDPCWYGKYQISTDPEAPTVNENVNVSLSITGTVVKNNLKVLPVPTEESGMKSGVNGSVSLTMRNTDVLGIADVADGYVYGNLDVEVTASRFADFYNGDLTVKNEEGVEIPSHHVTGTKTVKLDSETVTTLLNGKDPNEKGNKPSGGGEQSSFPILYVIIGGGVLLLAAVVVVIVVVASKKKKEKKA